MKLIVNTLSSIDMFGESVNLKLNGDNSHKSFIGALVTIAAVVLSIVNTIPSFTNYIYQTNPTISSTITYGNQNLTFNYTNFFFGISFFSPNGNVKRLDVSTNNFTAIQYLNQLNVSCPTCNLLTANNTEESVPNSTMNLCNSEMFSDITLKSMSSSNSVGITSIFTKYSFCFPEKMFGIIKSSNETNSTQDSSLQVYIPFNSKPIDKSQASSNNSPPPASSNVAPSLPQPNSNTNTNSNQSPQTQNNNNNNNNGKKIQIVKLIVITLQQCKIKIVA